MNQKHKDIVFVMLMFSLVAFAGFFLYLDYLKFGKETDQEQTYAFFKGVEGGYKTLAQIEAKPSELDKVVSFLIGSEEENAKLKLDPANPYLKFDAEVNKVEFSVWKKVR